MPPIDVLTGEPATEFDRVRATPPPMFPWYADVGFHLGDVIFQPGVAGWLPIGRRRRTRRRVSGAIAMASLLLTMVNASSLPIVIGGLFGVILAGLLYGRTRPVAVIVRQGMAVQVNAHRSFIDACTEPPSRHDPSRPPLT